jgi:hypothetical protein
VSDILQTFNQARLKRTRDIYKGARRVVRLHARHSLLLKLVGRYYLPYSGDLPADTASKVIAGSDQLAFLPPSQRLGPGWHRFRRRRQISVLWLSGVVGVLLVVSSLIGHWPCELHILGLGL